MKGLVVVIAVLGLVAAILMVTLTGGNDSAEADECSREDAQTVVGVMAPLVDDFKDALRRGDSTPRMSLSPIIGDMQRIHRDLQRAELPECGEELRSTYLRAFNAAIDGFLSFLGQESDSQVNRQIERAMTLLGYGDTDLFRMRSAAR
jgi:hypothetical protein